MILQQYYLQSVSQASYLVGDRESGLAVIVDPQRDIDQYLADLEQFSLTLQYIFLTHFHADFVAGHLELRRETGATICLGSRAKPTYPYQGLHDGYEIELGTTRLTVLETPGHTPEGISLVVYDRQQGLRRPKAILTGNTLLAGGVGRTDLLTAFGVTSQTLAAQLYDSLHHRLLTYPAETPIYPAHGAGTLCAKPLQNRLSSTLAEELETNKALRSISRQSFISLMTEHSLELPRYFSHVAFLNRRDRPLLDQVIHQGMLPLTLDQVLHEKSAGAQVLDVRSSNHYAAGHLCGSLNIGSPGSLERWAGTLLHQDNPIVLVTNSGQERETVIRLARVGLDSIIGYLDGGMKALEATPELIQRIEPISALQLQECLMIDNHLQLLDVRSFHEWKTRCVEGSKNIPLSDLSYRLSEISQDQPLVVYCSEGYRSSIAASLLQHHHFSKISDLIGGFEAWEEAIINPSLQSSSALQEPGGRRGSERA